MRPADEADGLEVVPAALAREKGLVVDAEMIGAPAEAAVVARLALLDERDEGDGAGPAG